VILPVALLLASTSLPPPAPTMPASTMPASAMPSIESAIRSAATACPKPASSGEITVCGHHDQDPLRFRLPPTPDNGFDLFGPVESVSRERNRLLDYNGDMTRGSCSPSGASGMTGCMIKKWREMDEQAGTR
jgi:hypothetical protein